MSQSLSKIYVHIVFSTKGRADMIPQPILHDVHSYIAGILMNENCPPISIGGTQNHIHILCILDKNKSASTLVGNIKSNSSKWIHETNTGCRLFDWQDGYSIFSVSQSQLKKTTQYIENQESHHHTESFKEEIIKFLKAYEIDYDERYLLG